MFLLGEALQAFSSCLHLLAVHATSSATSTNPRRQAPRHVCFAGHLRAPHERHWPAGARPGCQPWEPVLGRKEKAQSSHKSSEDGKNRQGMIHDKTHDCWQPLPLVGRLHGEWEALQNSDEKAPPAALLKNHNEKPAGENDQRAEFLEVVASVPAGGNAAASPDRGGPGCGPGVREDGGDGVEPQREAIDGLAHVHDTAAPQVGDRVFLQGLLRMKQLNGLTGTVVNRACDGRLGVRLHHNNELKSVLLINMRKIVDADSPMRPDAAGPYSFSGDSDDDCGRCAVCGAGDARGGICPDCEAEMEAECRPSIFRGGAR